MGGPSDFLLVLFILLAFYVRISILYTTDFNPRINRDVIIISASLIVPHCGSDIRGSEIGRKEF